MTSSVFSSVTVPSSKESTASVPVVAHQDLWIRVLTKLDESLPRSAFITWFKDTAVLGNENGTLIIGLPLPMTLTWHMEHYRGMTLDIARSLDPSIDDIVYQVDGGLKDNRERSIDLLEYFPEQKRRKVAGKAEVRVAEGITSKVLLPRYTLESFVVGANNRLAHAACQAVASAPGEKYNPLFLYGGVGLGKTHLLQGTGNEILRRMQRATVVYTTSEDFTNQVVEAIRTQKMEQFRRRYRPIDVLIVDDVQFFANKDRTQEEFFHTFNALFEDRRQVILSADRPPQELQLDERLISRFARGMIADVGVPDYETRLAILVEKAREYRLFMDMNVLQFIAEHTTRNVRELEGILMQAVAQYDLEQRMPTVKSIAEIMRKLSVDTVDEDENIGFQKAPAQRSTFQDVIEAVSRYYSISVQEMLGASRVREILVPRQIVMYIAKKYLNLSHVRIGELFSGRDHTTVMHSVSKIEAQMQNDAQLLREVHALEQELGFVK